MTKRPWMPLYVGDYLRDTRRLSAAEHGAYLLLIMEYWQAGSLPADDAQLARLACMSEREWAKAKPIISGFFSDGWVHERIEREMAKAGAKSAKRAEAGKRGGLASAHSKQLLKQTDGKPETNIQASSSDVTELSGESSELCPKPARRRVSYPDDFEGFWKAYPTDALMSKAKAAEAWKRLPAEERAAAAKAVPAFIAYCQQHPDYRPVHAVRFISERRFTGFVELAERTQARVYIKRDDPRWKPWEEFWRHTKDKSPPNDANGGWWFPGEMPPQMQPLARSGERGERA